MDPVMLKLHDRATQGEALTPEEQEQLERWYAAENGAEMEMLTPVMAQIQVSSLDISVLKSQLEVALAQLKTIAQQIEQVTAIQEHAPVEEEIYAHFISTLSRQDRLSLAVLLLNDYSKAEERDVDLSLSWAQNFFGKTAGNIENKMFVHQPQGEFKQRELLGESAAIFQKIMEISDRSSQLPVLDDRTADEILGYNAAGLPE
jgi:hypothetical protein